MRGAYWLCSSSPPQCLLCRAQTSMGALSGPSAYPEVSVILFKALLSVQLEYLPQDSAGLRNDPKGNSSVYVRSTDVALTSLMVVTQFVVHARCISALQLFPSSLSSSPRPHLHGRIIKAFCIPGGECDIVQSVAQCTTRISSPGLGWTA